MFSVHEEECLGACDAAPIVQVDFANHDRVTPDRMRELIDELRTGASPAPSRGSAPKDFRDASKILAGLGGAASDIATEVDKPTPPPPQVGSDRGQAEPQPRPTTQEVRGTEATPRGDEHSERPS
jgi:NADH-quinone oxidoreductase subunit E